LLEHGAFVALALLVIWVSLLIPLTRGTLKASPFGAASMFLALMIPFFWLGPEITEFTISKVGSFKTNAEQATKYFDEIKSIRAKIEAENHAVSAAVASVATLEKEAAELAVRVEEAKKLADPRTLNQKDQDHIKAGLESFRGTPYDLSFPPIAGPSGFEQRELLRLEPGSYLINHLIGTLASAGWELHSVEGNVSKMPLPFTQAIMSLGAVTEKANSSLPTILVGQITGVSGIIILWPQNNEKLKKPAFALALSLNQAGIWTDVDYPTLNDTTLADMFTSNAIHVVIGTKPF
jgi:hypothetical protein